VVLTVVTALTTPITRVSLRVIVLVSIALWLNKLTAAHRVSIKDVAILALSAPCVFITLRTIVTAVKTLVSITIQVGTIWASLELLASQTRVEFVAWAVAHVIVSNLTVDLALFAVASIVLAPSTGRVTINANTIWISVLVVVALSKGHALLTSIVEALSALTHVVGSADNVV